MIDVTLALSAGAIAAPLFLPFAPQISLPLLSADLITGSISGVLKVCGLYYDRAFDSSPFLKHNEISAPSPILSPLASVQPAKIANLVSKGA